MGSITELKGELQDLGNIVSFLVDVSAARLELGERSKAGLHEVGMRTLRSFDQALEELDSYGEGSAPS